MDPRHLSTHPGPGPAHLRQPPYWREFTSLAELCHGDDTRIKVAPPLPPGLDDTLIFDMDDIVARADLEGGGYVAVSGRKYVVDSGYGRKHAVDHGLVDSEAGRLARLEDRIDHGLPTAGLRSPMPRHTPQGPRGRPEEPPV